jgi:hypothetical protein
MMGRIRMIGMTMVMMVLLLIELSRQEWPAREA